MRTLLIASLLATAAGCATAKSHRVARTAPVDPGFAARATKFGSGPPQASPDVSPISNSQSSGIGSIDRRGP